MTPIHGITEGGVKKTGPAQGLRELLRDAYEGRRPRGS